MTPVGFPSLSRGVWHWSAHSHALHDIFPRTTPAPLVSLREVWLFTLRESGSARQQDEKQWGQSKMKERICLRWPRSEEDAGLWISECIKFTCDKSMLCMLVWYRGGGALLAAIYPKR